MRTQPFYFGRGERLFGVLDAPANQSAQGGVVICQPLGHEYVRSHRACRQLASRLAMAGFPVLRFDYGGCGDSLGESHEASLDSWLDDTGTAIEYMRRGSASVCVIGLRLGASLAMLAGARVRDVDRMVLWEPVVSGRAYLNEARVRHSEYEERHGWGPGRSLPAGLPSDVTEILGFPFSSPMIAAIERLDLRDMSAPAQRVLLLSNVDAGDPDILRTPLEAGVAVDRSLVKELTFWVTEPLMVPVDSIASIVQWVSRTTP